MTNIFYRPMIEIQEHIAPYSARESAWKAMIAIAQTYTPLCDYASQAEYNTDYTERDNPLSD